MKESTEISKRLLVPNSTMQGTLLTIWLIVLLMLASFLMYDSITQFESDVAHLAPDIPWVMFYLGIAACCEIIGLFILFTKRKWGFSLVASGELSSVILTFFYPLLPDTLSIIFSLIKLFILYSLFFMKGESVFAYKKSAKKPSMSISQFIGIIASICLIIAAVIAQITFPFYHPPTTIPIWQYTPTIQQYTPITIPSITVPSPVLHPIHTP